MKRILWATSLLATTLAAASFLGAAPPPARDGGGTLAGTVTRSDKGRIEVKQADGALVEVAVTAATIFKKGKASATAADVKPGARVTVEATKGKAGLEAARVQIEEAAAVVYTCPMHPEIQQPGPGKCPKCGMFLEKKG